MWFGGLRCPQRATLATRRNQLRASTDGRNLDPAFPRTQARDHLGVARRVFRRAPVAGVPSLRCSLFKAGEQGTGSEIASMKWTNTNSQPPRRCARWPAPARRGGSLRIARGVDSQSCLVVMFVRPCRPDRARCTERIQRARRRGEALGNAGGLRGHDHYDGVNDSW
jgi:hypothetical protein